MKSALKTFFVASFCTMLLGFAGATFWVQDWQYSRPTPRPKFLAQPAVGAALPASVLLPVALQGRDTGRPLFLHFFNPVCPCSRFNLDHVRQLTAQYGGRVCFVAVVQSGDPTHVSGDPRSLGLPMETIWDKDGAVARACGVYSTPQAVLLDRTGHLYYRGNYNSSRYCASAASQYARIALDSLLAGAPPPRLPASATLAYGCPLPSNIERTPRPL